MSAPEIATLAYAVLVALQIIPGALMLLTGQVEPNQYRNGARLLLTAPIAPLVLIGATARGIRALIRLADFKNERSNK